MPTKPNPSNSSPTGDYRYDALTDQVELLWKCLRCGELMPRRKVIPEICPSCGAPKTEFVLVDED
ncbi:MAG TPA: hypothetical protein VIJ93_06300 [bacterium]